MHRIRRFIAIMCLGGAALAAFDPGSASVPFVPEYRREQRLIGERPAPPRRDPPVQASPLAEVPCRPVNELSQVRTRVAR